MEASDLSLLIPLDALLQEVSVTAAARRVGLSTPAMSHALSRMRERFQDPLLIRAGRGMALTPRAEALKPRIHRLVSEARDAFEAPAAFEPSRLERTFVVHASDYVLAILGPALDRVLASTAPSLNLRFLANSPDDAAMARDGGSDLAVGIYGELPAEMMSRVLLTDRFVVLARRDHPALARRLSLEQFVALSHLQVAPRGRPGGYVDDVLRQRGLRRRVARVVPFFLSALELVRSSDHLLTAPERLATLYAEALGLRVHEPPLALAPYALSLIWHPRLDADPGHRWLRETIVAAAAQAARGRHDNARRRLDNTDPTSGQTRRRPRRGRA